MANIATYLSNIKNAVLGKEVRGSIHDGIDAINKEVESTTQKQSDLNDKQDELNQQFKNLIINAGNSNAEVAASRGSYDYLPDRLDAVDEQFNTIQSEKANKEDVAKISSGTPLFASSTTEMTDTTRNYVNTTDGYLYVYIGNSWTKTIQYQSTGIADKSITPQKTSFYTELKGKVDNFSTAILDINFETSGVFVSSTNYTSGEGLIVSHASYLTTDLIKVYKGNKIKINACTSKNCYILSSWSKNGTFIKGLIIGDNSNTYYEYTVQSDIEYIRVCTNTTLSAINIQIESNEYKKVKSIDGRLSIVEGEIEFKDVALELNLTIGKYIASSENTAGLAAGDLGVGATYGYSNLIKLEQGDKIKINACTSKSALVLSEYNAEGVFVSELIKGDNSTTYYEYIANKDMYIKVCNNSSLVSTPSLSRESRIYTRINNLKQELEINDNHISPQELRKPLVCFTFDDGTTSDVNVYNILNEYGFKCGFSLLSTNNRISEYLKYQNEGFEILSHSTDSVSMNDESVSATEIENKMKTSKKVLEGYGFEIKGWVTPSSKLHDNFLPLVKKYYEYAYTQLLGVWTELNGTNPFNLFTEDTRKLYRMSVESSTLEDNIKAIDKTIENNGLLSFYAHDYPNSNKLTEEKFRGVLDYLKQKVDNDECLVLTPYKAYNNYFSLRHDDYLSLLNK